MLFHSAQAEQWRHAYAHDCDSTIYLIIAIYDDVQLCSSRAHPFAPTADCVANRRKRKYMKIQIRMKRAATSAPERTAYKTAEVLCSASSVAVRHLVECHRTTCINVFLISRRVSLKRVLCIAITITTAEKIWKIYALYSPARCGSKDLARLRLGSAGKLKRFVDC